jgi:hypothetical protein
MILIIELKLTVGSVPSLASPDGATIRTNHFYGSERYKKEIEYE